MPLKFKGEWRFTPPADGQFQNQRIPPSAVEECIDLIMKVATHKSDPISLDTWSARMRGVQGGPR